MINWIKKFKRASARYGLFVTSRLIGILPYGGVKALAKILILIGFQLTVKLKRIARESLQIAFGKSLTQNEIEGIVKRCFSNFGQGMIDLIYFNEHPDQVKDYFTIEGKHHLDEALKQGRGVVAVTAHFGNFPLMQLAFAQFGYKVKVIIRRARDAAIADYVRKKMTQVGVGSIYSMPARKCVQESLQALRNNEIVFVLLDQNFGSGSGVFVEFFGQKAATGVGPVVFAERAHAPLMPIFNIQEDGNRHRIIIEPAVPLKSRDDRDEMLTVNVANITRIIERYIRKYPHEWGWMHRRWKSRPSAQKESSANG